MYIPGFDHIRRRKQLGKSTNPDTMTEGRIYIKRIMSLWGERNLTGFSSRRIFYPINFIYFFSYAFPPVCGWGKYGPSGQNRLYLTVKS
jgi:hypothetical protein